MPLRQVPTCHQRSVAVSELAFDDHGDPASDAAVLPYIPVLQCCVKASIYAMSLSVVQMTASSPAVSRLTSCVILVAARLAVKHSLYVIDWLCLPAVGCTLRSLLPADDANEGGQASRARTHHQIMRRPTKPPGPRGGAEPGGGRGKQFTRAAAGPREAGVNRALKI